MRVLKNHPQGLETLAGLHGKALSGGQKQIIYLLRCYLSKKPIIIPTNNKVKPKHNVLYVVPHYYYLYSNYLISEKLNSNSLIYLNELGGTFIPDKPMDYVLHEGENLFFECESATDGTEFSCYVYWGNRLICNSLIASFNKDTVKSICAFINNIND